MSEAAVQKAETGLVRPELGLSKLEVEAIQKLDEVAGLALELGDAGGPFGEAFQQSMAMQQISEILTDKMVQRFIMPLYNSRIGFLADLPNKSTRATYPVAVVRSCTIEAVMRGARVVGNEFNILAGGCYLTKNYFERKVCTFPLLSDLKILQQVPRNADGGSVVPFSATWSINGVADAIEGEIPIRYVEKQTVDAILGKSKRKALARIYERLTGSVVALPEGEVGEPGTEPIATEEKTARQQKGEKAKVEIDPNDVKAEEPVLLSQKEKDGLEKIRADKGLSDEAWQRLIYRYAGATTLDEVDAQKKNDLLRALNKAK